MALKPFLTRASRVATLPSLYSLNRRAFTKSALSRGGGHDSSPVDTKGYKRPEPQNYLPKEEWVNLARNWPIEHFAPANQPAFGNDDPPKPERFTEAQLHGDFSDLRKLPPTYSLFGLFVTLALMLRLNHYLFSEEEVHPLTLQLAKLKEFLNPRDEILASRDRAIAHVHRVADDNLILQAGIRTRQGVDYFTSHDGLFENASPFMLEPGVSVKVDDVKIKHLWQLDDDIMPPKKRA